VRLLRRLAREERGTTLTELMIGMGASLVVLGGLMIVTMVSMDTTTRVSARVQATQQSRLALTRVIDQLHSACIAPKVPPIRVASSNNELRFVRATGSAVVPTPVLTKITYSGDSLTQRDYSWKSGSAPFWTFNETTPVRTSLLYDRVTPVAGKPIFSYYGYASGAISPTPLVTPLSELDASRTIFVTVQFQTNPRDNGEDSTPARIQGSASLRLTASSYNPNAPSLPCQ
jgi:hypothetical protein